MSTLPENINITRYISRKSQFSFYMAAKRMEYNDVTVCLEGEMIYYVDGERCELRTGDVLVIPMGKTRMRNRHNHPVSYVSFNVECSGDQSIDFCGVIREGVNKRVEYLLDLFAKEWLSTSALREEKCKSLFTYIMLLLLDSKPNEQNVHVSKIKKYIEKHLFEQITLDMLSGELHLAPQYICALFKRHTGLTVTEYINGERISAACRRILTDDATLYDIAESCGFPNYNYFSNVFKALTGVSPSVYRKTAGK